MSAAKPSSFRLIATLGFSGVLSGFILVGAYLVTLPYIQANQAKRLQQAVFRLLPGSTRMAPLVVEGNTLTPYQSKGGELPSQEAVYAGYNQQDKLVGYAIPAEGPGFADVVKILYAFDPHRRTVVGLEVLETKETPGLGDKIIDDKEFHASLKNLKVEPNVVLQKRGPPQAPNEVDAISGATISSAAVVKILNASTARWLPVFAAAAPPGAGE